MDKNIFFLCSTEELKSNRFGTAWRWLHDYRNLFFWPNNLFNSNKWLDLYVFCKFFVHQVMAKQVNIIGTSLWCGSGFCLDWPTLCPFFPWSGTGFWFLPKKPALR